MRIEKLSLRDFLSHERTEVTFKGDINVIIGHNGAGKSSLVDGILFALFRDARGKQEELVKKGKTTSEVELWLKDQLSSVYVKRVIPTSKSDQVLINGRLEARSANEVTRKIERLGLDEKVLPATVFVKQGDIESIFDSLTDVLKKIMKITNLEKLTESGGRIPSLIKEYDTRIKLSERDRQDLNKIQSEREQEEKKITELQERISSLKGERSKLEEEKGKLEKEIEELGKKKEMFIKLDQTRRNVISERERIISELKDLENVERDISETQREIERLEALRGKREILTQLEEKTERKLELEKSVKVYRQRKEKLESDVKLKESLEPVYREYVRLKEDKEKLGKSHDMYLSLSSALNEKRDALKKEQRKLDLIPTHRDLELIDKELKSTEGEITELNEEISSLANEKKQLEKSVESLKTAKGGKCPVCNGPLDDLHRRELLEEYTQRIKDIEGKVYKLRASLTSLQGKRENLEKELMEAKRLEDRKRDSMENVNKLSTEIKSLEDKVEELRRDEESYINVDRRLKEIEQKAVKYLTVANASREELESIEMEIASMDQRLFDIENDIENLRKQLGDVTAKDIEESERKLSSLKERLSLLQSKLGRKRVLSDRLETLEDEQRRVEGELASLNFNAQVLERKNNELKVLLAQLETLSRDEATEEGRLTSSMQNLERIRKTEEEIKERLLEVSKFERAKERLERLRKVLGEGMLQSYLISTLKGRIENNLNDIVSMFNLSFVRIEIIIEQTRSLTGKVNLSVRTPAGQTLSINMLSGGERIAIALGLRLAIAKTLMGELGFMILDEPTIHLDSQRRAELLEVIRESMNVVPQIIVVTHDEEVLRIADFVIRVEKVGESSRVKEEIPQ
ncbi:AAA family ATPase [Metallosphaera tengchongensis]|uniref:DNA double-strand break repair Rad50 ATPase n=1 Tax=Metallosphaera tengchongensis TaxID=1532350 RepID=A0A6N0NXW3_9CREN|nr:AAA family ATPase [Metallosphaera tengchongensis]QKR00429.1 AAA family ATPase [Metallosphaera tengchongensis]